MTIPRSQAAPEDPRQLPPARRRRAGRTLAPLDAAEKHAFWNEAARRAEPSVDFFLYLALATVVWALGLSVDSPALLLFGALLAPLMAPVVGLGLGIITGAARYFGHVLGGIVLGSLLAFGLGVLGGAAALLWAPPVLHQAPLHAHLAVWDFAVLAMASVWGAVALARRPGYFVVPGAALAYEVFLPLVTAGFGLGSGAPHLFPDGLVVFAVHLAWAALFAAVGFAVLGFRPLTLFGYTLSGVAALVGGVVLVMALGVGTAVSTQVALPTPIPTPTPVPPSPTATLTPSPTPVPPTATPTPTPVPTATPTPTATFTPTPTPAYARAAAPAKYGGVLIRAAPGFNHKIVGGVSNGEVVLVVGPEEEVDNYVWVRVRVPSSGVEGWVLEHLLEMATPQPNW